MPPASCCLLFLCHIFDPSEACSSFHIPGTGSPRSLERKEAHPKLYKPFQEAVILFDEVVEIFALSQFTRLWHDPFRFQLASKLWDRPRFYQL